jgi:phosphoribosylaminoimidazole (AIR) synthetase
LAELFGYPLLTGEAKETAGGMLIAVAKEDADNLLDDLHKRGVGHFEVGYVKDGNGGVLVQKNVKVVEA